MKKYGYYEMLQALVKQKKYLENCLNPFYGRIIAYLTDEEIAYVCKIIKLSTRVTMEIEFCKFMICKGSLFGIED